MKQTLTLILLTFLLCNVGKGQSVVAGESDTTIIGSNNLCGFKVTTRYYFKAENYSQAAEYVRLDNVPYDGLNDQSKKRHNELRKYIIKSEQPAIDSDRLTKQIDPDTFYIKPLQVIHLDSSLVYYLDTVKETYDTVKVIMLICDTTTYSFHVDSNIKATVHDVIWQFGYEVRKYIPAGWDNYDNQHSDYYAHFDWLDTSKQPLPASTIVWMAEKIK